MDNTTRAKALLKRLWGVAWFVLSNPFLIIRKAILWAAVAFFWLFLLGWLSTAWAAEWTPAGSITDYNGTCTTSQGYSIPNSNIASCKSGALNYFDTSYNKNGAPHTISSTQDYPTYIRFNICNKQGECHYFANLGKTKPSQAFVCPPDGKPLFTVGPKTLNGQQVCEKKPVSCKIGEQLFMDSSTGAETCKANCSSVAGQTHDNMAYNQAFLPSATVLCYGLCSVTSSGVTVGNANTFEQFGTITFTGQTCPVTFPEEGEGDVIGPPPPESSEGTNNAQGDLQDATNNATNNPVSGATGTADLKDVVDKLAETSNAEVKAMSEQNAAMGKLVENVGKDIQSAIRDSAHGSGAASAVGQIQTANAIKDGNKTLEEIKDKLDEQKEDPKPPVVPGTDLGTKPSDIHKGNNWDTRNFSTVLSDHASRMGDLPIFSTPTRFFKFETGGATCPVYNGNFSILGYPTSFSLESFCDPAIINLFPYLRGVILLVFGFFAWRIAVGNWG
ncbi:hypothetical protein [Aeromonas veronii]|uniref:hypothetical protein n=1 Tax=Aeromonas veronii TaxID=654 RepID=UPI0027DD9813|nr:hypothetical protein [Aeromonas veronii]WMJ06994.1 hypothetical protein RBH93_10725 [Aeromonas veronii]WMJ07003.1 hypothetical protein RBH93_10770 [Aeromonas veronii]